MQRVAVVVVLLKLDLDCVVEMVMVVMMSWRSKRSKFCVVLYA